MPSASSAASSPVQAEGKSCVFRDCPSPGKTARSGHPWVPSVLLTGSLGSFSSHWVSPTPRVGEIITYLRISGSSHHKFMPSNVSWPFHQFQSFFVLFQSSSSAPILTQPAFRLSPLLARCDRHPTLLRQHYRPLGLQLPYSPNRKQNKSKQNTYLHSSGLLLSKVEVLKRQSKSGICPLRFFFSIHGFCFLFL